jgi:glycerol-3-phosphate dehydrogenase
LAPLLSVFGGKITTSRKLAEAAMAELKPFFPAMTGNWTATAKLPGGDFNHAEVEQHIAELQKNYSFLKPAIIRRLFKAYGTEAGKMLAGARFAADLGPFIGTLSQREIEYLKANEWAETAEDILWRRSKLGLHMKKDEQEALRALMEGARTRKKGADHASDTPSRH